HKKDFRSQGYRILLGDYNCDDENFISSTSNSNLGISNQQDIEVPLGDDYIGIRRALWSYTETAFKNCVKDYLDKKAYFKDNPDKKPSIPDFTKQDSVKYLKNSIIEFLEQSQVENLVKKVSIAFQNYDEISMSRVYFNQIRVYVYLLSTEGTMCKIPLDYSSIAVTAGINNDSTTKEPINESVEFYEKNPKNFLAKSDNLINSCKKLAEYIIKLNKLENEKNSYYGPVILSDLASSKFFSMALLGKENNLFAERLPIAESPEHYSFLLKKESLEERIGTKIIPSDFSVVDKPKLENFKNKTLLGTSYIDNEGTVTTEELTLIQNGELKTLLSSRVPTRNISYSNGHKRIGITASGTFSAMAPSNLFVSYKNGTDEGSLKSKLIELCKEKNIDYGIEITSLDSSADRSPLIFCRIDKDGTEQLIKPMSMPAFDFTTFDKIEKCTSKDYISNVSYRENAYNLMNLEGFSINGCFMSLIVPSSILLRDINLKINTSRFPTF
ncbi:MAG: metallopeptidase TldD-related protein, partial [Bacteroidales bacterium]